MPIDDLLKDPIVPLAAVAEHLVLRAGAPPTAGVAARLLVLLLALVGLTFALTAVASAARARAQRDSTSARTVALAASATALLLFVWLVRHPAPHLDYLVGRWDHLAFAAAFGVAIADLRAPLRTMALALVCVPFLVMHAGPTTLGITLGGCVLGYAALRLPLARGPWATAVVQAVVLGGVVVVALAIRTTNRLWAAQLMGLFAWMLLRHVSFVVDVRRGRRATFADFACFTLFYPGFVGSSEVYGEFQDRNLGGARRYPYAAIRERIVFGGALVVLIQLLPVDLGRVLAATGTLETWVWSIALFVHGAVFLMGMWSIIEGIGLFYGVQLRQNFPLTVLSQNPAQLWRSWRATMTNWLIRYVYMPVGSGHSQTVRIGAAFGVSVLWHWMGIPFSYQHPSAMALVPAGLWGLANALAVLAYVSTRGRPWRVLPAWVPSPVRTASKVVLTACLGALTVTLLGFNEANLHLLPGFVGRLLGLRWGLR
jgi:hypothetical protein